MTWFKVDDSFYDHPKVVDAPDCAVALWTRAGSWSSRYRTGGFVPTGMLARFCDDPERGARELTSRRLWSRTRGGYQFHDWPDYNPTADEATAAVTKMSSGGALGNHRRWHVDKGRSEPDCRYCQAKHDRVPDRGPDAQPESPPNPPDPARPDPKGGGVRTSVTTARASPPPRTCEEHTNVPDPPSCRRCQAARIAHDAWYADRNGRSDASPRCSRHGDQPAHNCAPCRSERIAAGEP